MDKINVLLVDDDAADRKLVKLTLSQSQHPVEFVVKIAVSLSETLEHLEKPNFDLIILDLGLPDSFGLETINSVHNAVSQIPIIVLTNLSNEEAGVEAIKRGAEDYLVKGKFFRESLARTIRYAIERKRSKEKQTRLLEELDKVNHELKDFAYIVSHDLKAPLRGLKTIAKWLATDYADKLDENGRSQLYLLIDRADQMHKLIDGVLAYSKVGRTAEEEVEIELNDLVSSIIDSIDVPENIAITIENQLPIIVSEQTRIMQLFQNLISNAVKYLDHPKGQIKIDCAEDGDFWRFSVADNGPGIKEKDFERIFKIFETTSRRDESKNTGIGLTIAKKIVELYNGKIWVESTIGQGSTFFFILPKTSVDSKETELSTVLC